MIQHGLGDIRRFGQGSILFVDKGIYSVEMGLLSPPFNYIAEVTLRLVHMQWDISVAGLVLVIS